MKHIPRLIIYYFLGLHFACQFTPTNNAQGLEQKNVDDIITNHTIVDSIPKNRIMIEDPPPNIGNWIYVFYDKD
ncbi:MAG: hypothetical protein SFV22_19725, partial [Saprospiraceae bacterium]|nr:hypothetical protein [Saprospiraceae bacterium]